MRSVGELEAEEHKTAVRSCSVKGAPDTCAIPVSRPGSGGGAAGQTQWEVVDE